MLLLSPAKDLGQYPLWGLYSDVFGNPSVDIPLLRVKSAMDIESAAMHRNQISLMPVLRRNLVTRFLPILPLITKSGNQLVVLPVKRNPPIQLPYCKNIPMDISSTRPTELVIDGPNEISLHVVVLQPVVLAITDQQGRLLSPGIDQNIVTNIELSLLLTLASKTFHIVPIPVIEVHKRFTVPVLSLIHI